MWLPAYGVLFGFAGKRVLEVGSGSNPLVAFAALRHCRLAVATDGSPEALSLLERNVTRNSRYLHFSLAGGLTSLKLSYSGLLFRVLKALVFE